MWPIFRGRKIRAAADNDPNQWDQAPPADASAGQEKATPDRVESEKNAI